MFKRLDEPVEFRPFHDSDVVTPDASFESAEHPGCLCHLVFFDNAVQCFHVERSTLADGRETRYHRLNGWPVEVVLAAAEIYAEKAEPEVVEPEVEQPEDGLLANTTAKELKARAVEVGCELSKGATSKAKMQAEIRAHLGK